MKEGTSEDCKWAIITVNSMGEESWTRDEQDERFKREKGISNSFELAIDLIPTQILNIDPPTTIDCICF